MNTNVQSQLLLAGVMIYFFFYKLSPLESAFVVPLWWKIRVTCRRSLPLIKENTQLPLPCQYIRTNGSAEVNFWGFVF